MSQKELAAATGVGERTIGRLERGETSDPQSLDVVQEFLGITSDQDGNEEEPPLLLREASMYDLLAEIMRRHNAALNRAVRPVVSYEPGVPDPDGLLRGPDVAPEDLADPGKDGEDRKPGS